MIPIVGKIHKITAVAVSGGVDSMALLSFIKNTNPLVKAVFFHHKTETSDAAYKFLQNYCSEQRVVLVTGWIQSPKNKKDSWEQHWRTERYKFLWSLEQEKIATAHHLNDVAETYMMGCINGNPRYIMYRQLRHGRPTNVVRPFLLAKKSDLKSWCHRHKVPYIEDQSNSDTKFSRNRVRHNIIPEVMEVNSGFLSVVSRKLKEEILDKCECEGGAIKCIW